MPPSYGVAPQPVAPSAPGGYAPAAPYGSAPSAPGLPPTGMPPAPAAFPGQPYAAMTPGAAMPPKKNGFMIPLILILVVVLGLGAFLAYWFGLRDKGGGTVTPGEAKTAQNAVRGYLEALAAGHAQDALSFASKTPTDTTYLTDEVLAASNANGGGLTNIVVQPADNPKSSYAMVSASYNIGTQTVRTQYTATKNGNYYFLDNVVNDVGLYGISMSGVDATLNGVPITTDSVTVFPGTYNLAINNSLLTLTPTSFTVTDPMDFAGSFTDVKVELSADAPAKFAAAAKATLDACMAEKSLQTSCGLWVNPPSVTTVIESSIAWTFRDGSSSDDFAAATWEWWGDGLTATASVDIAISVDMDGANGHHYYNDYQSIYRANVDFTDPANLVVTFES